MEKRWGRDGEDEVDKEVGEEVDEEGAKGKTQELEFKSKELSDDEETGEQKW